MRRAVLLPAALAGLVAAALVVSLVLPHGFVESVMAGMARLRAFGVLGWLAFIVAQALIALVGVLPASLLGIAAGAVYGVAAGFAASAIGVVAGALIAFGLSRSAFRPVIAARMQRSRRLQALDDGVARDAWRLVLLLRISPVMPFSLTSYALGLSSVTVRDYLIGTLGSLPALLGYVGIGALGGSSLAAGSQRGAVIHAALLLLGAAATLLLTVHLTRLLARALRAAA